MERTLQGLLDEDEKLLWRRLPSRAGCDGAVRAVQLLGHLLLTLMAVGLAVFVPARTAVKVLTGAIFCISANAPLFVWAFARRRRRLSASDSLYFVTNRRVGALSPSGEFRQIPLSAGLQVNLLPGMIEFVLHEQTSLSFTGLRDAELRLVAALAKNVLPAGGGEPQAGTPEG